MRGATIALNVGIGVTCVYSSKALSLHQPSSRIANNHVWPKKTPADPQHSVHTTQCQDHSSTLQKNPRGALNGEATGRGMIVFRMGGGRVPPLTSGNGGDTKLWPGWRGKQVLWIMMRTTGS